MGRLQISMWIFQNYSVIWNKIGHEEARQTGRLLVPSTSPCPPTEPIPGYYSNNGWLEELGLLLAWQALTIKERQQVEATLGMRGLEAGIACVEADAILVRGHRLCAIEAKAGKIRARGVNANRSDINEVHQCASKLKSNFGPFTRLIYIAPRYKLSPPGASVEQFRSQQVDLCWEEHQVKTAIRSALGFPEYMSSSA
jgi:hypothetical protein